MSRKDRLNEVYEYVRSHFPVHTKNDFADKLKYHRTYISSAMHGNEKYLTDKLFMNICEAFPDTFNLDYLLTGNGQLLSLRENENDVTSIQKSRNVTSQSNIDISSVFNAALAAKDETIRAKEEVIISKEETIASLHDTIEALKCENALLRKQLSKYQAGDILEHHPFPIGVADAGKNNNKEQART